ncbi:MAG: efflux RND transporter periplasmic adaptor subunit [Wenzhouxiangellaceae bacterium]|nr:efflux RND transporter periplasmic adaptor subunit [Wenzhouxiangellaceae bacterium]
MNKALKIAVPVLIVAAAALVAILLAMAGGEPERREAPRAALLVDVVRPEINRDAFVIHAQGTVTPRNQAELVSQVSGKVIWQSDEFVAGGVFESGEVLARIDPSDYETALLAAEAELAAARATLSDEQARSDAARADFRRLYGDSREPGDLMLRLPQVARARAAVQAREAAVERARRDLERTRITLPFDGMVRERNVDLGQYVSTGTSLGVAFSTDRAEVRLSLGASDLKFLDLPPPGTQKRLEIPVKLTGSVAGRNATWDATLVRTEGVVDSNTRLTWVVAEVVDPYDLKSDRHALPLPVGTFVEARIAGRDASGLAVLPTEAVHDGNRIYMADAEDRLEIRTVDVVRTTPREVYIDGELTAEDRVITTAIPAPIPGLKLNVRERAETEPRLRILPAGELAASSAEDRS